MLLSLGALGACMPPGATTYAPLGGPASPRAGIDVARPAGHGVAILLPLTGPQAELGQSLLHAAQLAYEAPLDQRDTGGTPDGAAAAARAAIGAGAGLIIGPLTSAETAAVAPVARAASVPVLAFTSDTGQAQPGVWTLGITPAQQVRRLVLAVQAEGKTRFAAVVPDNAFGAALAAGLRDATTSAGLPPPTIATYSGPFANLNDALHRISDFDNRRGAIEARQRAARASVDADGRARAAEIGRETPGAAPFDALLLGAIGDQLGQAVPLLAYYDIPPEQVRIMGPALWSRDAARLPALSGAWFAAPDPALRASFETRFVGKYNVPSRDLSSVAFDAAAIARVIDGNPTGLVRPEGFAGADGVLGLMPDGQVRRGLAIFEVDRGGAHIVQPAPQTLAAPGT